MNHKHLYQLDAVGSAVDDDCISVLRLLLLMPILSLKALLLFHTSKGFPEFQKSQPLVGPGRSAHQLENPRDGVSLPRLLNIGA